MPKFLEKKLKKEYGSDSDIPYKIMNSMGAMRGSQETEKGREMEQKHNRKMGLVRRVAKKAEEVLWRNSFAGDASRSTSKRRS